MPEPQVVAVAEQTSTTPNWTSALLQSSVGLLTRLGEWATSTSHRFGGIVSALLSPVVVSVYVLAFWSLTADIGWTGAFMVSSGAFSNWMVWLGIAVVMHGAASILKRQSRTS
jgi:hypothetical protein